MNLSAMFQAAFLVVGSALIPAACAAPQPWTDVGFDLSRPAEAPSVRIIHADGSATNMIWLEFPGGAGGWFVLDTGAGFALMDDDFARGLGLTSTRNVNVNGQPAELMQADSVSVGRITINAPMFVTLDIDALAAAPGSGFDSEHPVAGIIGYSLLQSAIVRIEYGVETDRVFLHQPAGYELPAGDSWITTRLVDRSPTIEAEVAGASGLFKLDTGKTFTASLTAAFVAANGLDKGVKTEFALNRRIEGDVEERVATISYFTFGGRRFDNPRVSFRIQREETASELAGVIGREFLKEFTMTLDYPGNRIALTPRPQTNSER